ncbi:hypothetical protein BJ165DRAFT_360523 [Panaeolus papilionaceus]|nr:hypothetical protein BJ165DRAFT_360523 [Panaeolus papilionaceus]
MDQSKTPHILENGLHPNGTSGRHHLSKNLSKGWRLFARCLDFVEREMTFFRLHLAAFTFIPLIFSGIFFASNGRYHISFLDSMFLCYSAMTVTGLSTVNLSTLTWQQVIMYFLMIIGDITIISRYLFESRLSPAAKPFQDFLKCLRLRRYFLTHCEFTVTASKTLWTPGYKFTEFIVKILCSPDKDLCVCLSSLRYIL